MSTTLDVRTTLTLALSATMTALTRQTMRCHFVLSVEALPCVEPKHDMNSFSEPIVIELLELQHGVSMTVSTSQTDIFIQCLLLSVACDLAAVRKVLGFSARV